MSENYFMSKKKIKYFIYFDNCNINNRLKFKIKENIQQETINM